MGGKLCLSPHSKQEQFVTDIDSTRIFQNNALLVWSFPKHACLYTYTWRRGKWRKPNKAETGGRGQFWQVLECLVKTLIFTLKEGEKITRSHRNVSRRGMMWSDHCFEDRSRWTARRGLKCGQNKNRKTLWDSEAGGLDYGGGPRPRHEDALGLARRQNMWDSVMDGLR